MLVRIAYGARVSLLVGVAGDRCSRSSVGVVVGLAAGFLGGVVDTVLARLVDVVLSVPFLLVAIALVSVTGPSLTITVLVIGFFSWASVARIVRGQVLSITRARVRRGGPVARAPATSGSCSSTCCPTCWRRSSSTRRCSIPVVIVVQATLSFLGLGLAAADRRLGRDDQRGAELLPTAWWFIVLPRRRRC